MHSSAAAAQEEGWGASGREGAASSSVPALNLLLGLSFPSRAALGGGLWARFASPSLFHAAPKRCSLPAGSSGCCRSGCTALSLSSGQSTAPGRAEERGGQPKAEHKAMKREREKPEIPNRGGGVGILHKSHSPAPKSGLHPLLGAGAVQKSPFISVKKQEVPTGAEGGWGRQLCTPQLPASAEHRGLKCKTLCARCRRGAVPVPKSCSCCKRLSHLQASYGDG